MERMRILLLAALAAGITVLGAQSGGGSAQDEAQIRDIVKKYVDAREHSDPKATEALFTPDADQLVSSGEWRKGRSNVVRGAMASSERTGGTRTIEVESIRFLEPGIAIADGRYEISGMANGGTRKMWTTLVMKKGSDGWRIAAIRNMLPAPPAGSGRR
jgi:uncharacterized protein (TIGR02246 family)